MYPIRLDIAHIYQCHWILMLVVILEIQNSLLCKLLENAYTYFVSNFIYHFVYSISRYTYGHNKNEWHTRQYHVYIVKISKVSFKSITDVAHSFFDSLIECGILIGCHHSTPVPQLHKLKLELKFFVSASYLSYIVNVNTFHSIFDAQEEQSVIQNYVCLHFGCFFL